jgi:hypothetical protein
MSTIEQSVAPRRAPDGVSAVPALVCPRCGLVETPRRSEPVEHCPRCLAQTAGALSIVLEPRKDPTRSRARDAIERLARRVRAA